MDFSANRAFHKQSEGPTRDGGSSTEPGLGFTAVYHIFLLSFPLWLSSSGFLFSCMQTGDELGAVGWAAAIPSWGCSCWSRIRAGIVPWVLCPAQPGCKVPEQSPIISKHKHRSRQTPFALEHTRTHWHTSPQFLCNQDLRKYSLTPRAEKGWVEGGCWALHLFLISSSLFSASPAPHPTLVSLAAPLFPSDFCPSQRA